MKKYFLALCLVAAAVRCQTIPDPSATPQGFTKLMVGQVKHLQNSGSSTKRYRSTLAYREYDDDDSYDGLDNAPESSQDRAPTLVNQNYPVPVKSTLQPVANYQQRPNNAQRVYQVPAALIKPGNRPQPHLQPFPSRSVQDANKLEEEKEEPDRLSLLLPQSKFSCTGKHTGYYSDEFLGCEVFHYCQDNARHSWICPEGFTFHQVHLICMPPGGDNICEKSSDFHFVNDFLYKPVNLEEYQQRPNVTLKYSDRYFPNSYGHYTEDGEGVASNYKHSVRVTQQPHVQTVAAVSRPQVATVRPQATTGQVYRNPEDINIPLQQRRPANNVQYTTAKYLDDY